MVEMRRNMQDCLKGYGGDTERNRRTFEIRIYYVFVLNMEIKISSLNYYFLLYYR